METAAPGELPEYQMLPAPLASQHGALVGYAGAGPGTGKTSPLGSTRAKLSGLCAGLNPRILPQKAAPSGVLLAVAGRVTTLLAPASAPYHARGNCRTDPDFKVTAAHVRPTAI